MKMYVEARWVSSLEKKITLSEEEVAAVLEADPADRDSVLRDIASEMAWYEGHDEIELEDLYFFLEEDE